MRGLVWMGALVATSAMAVPMTMTHSGRLLDASGTPLTGTHSVTVNLYDQDGLLAWGDTFSAVPFESGYYAVVLGSNAGLPASALAADTLTVAVSVDGGPEMVQGEPLGSVPFAIRTEETRNLRGGSVEATTITGDSVTASGAVMGGSLSTSGALTAGSIAADTIASTSLAADTLVVGRIEADEVQVSGLDFGGPVVGEWYPSDSYAAANGAYHLMVLNRQTFNTDTASEYFTWDGASTITFNHAGFYRVDLRTITHNNGFGNHVQTLKNDSNLHLSHLNYNATTSWRRHATSVVSHFAVGDTLKVRVYCNTSTSTWCYHSGPNYTALTVQLMR